MTEKDSDTAAATEAPPTDKTPTILIVNTENVLKIYLKYITKLSQSKWVVCLCLFGVYLGKPQEVLHEGAGVAIFNFNYGNLVL